MACAGPPRRSGTVDVDALWLALKARTAVARPPATPPVSPPHKRDEGQAKEEPETAPPPLTRDLQRQQQQHQQASTAAPAAPVTTRATLEQLLERMARALKPRERLQALEAVAAAAAVAPARRDDDADADDGDGDSSNNKRHPGALEVAKALVRRAVDDLSEALRERAADVLADLLLLRPNGGENAATAADRADSDDDDNADDNNAPAPAPPPSSAAGPSSPPPSYIAPLTDAEAQELLPYVVPALTERLLAERPRSGVFQQQQQQRPSSASSESEHQQPQQAAPSHEPSEEARLALLRAFAAAVRRSGASRAFAPYGAEALAVVERAASTRRRHGGGSSSAHLAACDLARCLERAMGACLQPIAMPLTAALAPLTASRRSAVRAAAVRAMAPLAHRGAHEAALLLVGHRDPHVVPISALAAKVGQDGNGDDDDEQDIHARLDLKTNFCGRLAADPSPRVRLAFVSALLRDWLTRLPGRRDHEARLVPFVLGALVPHLPRPSRWEGGCGGGRGDGGGRPSNNNADADADAVASAAAALLEELGAQHERDVAREHNGDDEKRVTDGADGKEGALAYAGSPANAAKASVVLPGPFAERPSRGARALCGGAVLSGMVGAACAELSASWQPSVRWRSAALMAVTLVVVEDAADRHLPTIVPALCKALSFSCGNESSVAGADDEAAAALRWSRRCCEVLGVFCDGDALWSLLRPLCCHEQDPRRQAAAVSVLALVVRGARAAASSQPLLARRALEMVVDAEEGLRDMRDVGLSAAVRDLVREAAAAGGGGRGH